MRTVPKKRYNLLLTLFIILALYFIVSNEINIRQRIDYENAKEECHGEGKCVKSTYFSAECIDCSEM